MPEPGVPPRPESGAPIARFVGGVNLPRRLLGRTNATWPLGLLEVGERAIQLRMRPKQFSVELYAAPDQLTAVFPVGVLLRRGVGFQTRDGSEWYFWTFRRERVLGELLALGYPVDRTRRQPLCFRRRR